MDLKDVADELIEKEQMGRITESMGEFLDSRGMFDLKVDKTARKGMSDEELAKKLTDDDPDRTNNAMGGINRIGYRDAGRVIRLASLLKERGTTVAKAIKNAIDNFIQPSGDKKYDADVILDDMLEELDIDRDTLDQKEVLDVYDKIYTTISKPRSFKGTEIKDPKFDEGMPFDNDAEKLAEIKMSNERYEALEGVDPRDTILPSKEFDLQEGLDDLDNLNLGSKKGDVVSKQLKIMRLAEDIQPGLFEKLTDMQLEIITKYGDVIDDNLLKQIVLDKDPNNQALALAQIEEAKVMLDKGMDVNEILRIQGESLNRRKQAEGGLAYLMGL
jgi:hypothetical protein